jgi:hypothetical protein
MTTITVWAILFAYTPSTPPSIMAYEVWPTRGACEHEIVRMRLLAMSLKLTPADAWCQQLVERK